MITLNIKGVILPNAVIRKLSRYLVAKILSEAYKLL
uniref:Uncharacterized protein n=1 Tax=uncultured Desulfobacterium sp. TaxID=201089 RepID=E1YAD5_9BACT|nr:unknown protein [uncultured Desulfobacterium sp.]